MCLSKDPMEFEFKNNVLFFSGSLDKTNIPEGFAKIRRIKARDIHSIDLRGIERIDSAGVSFLEYIKHHHSSGESAYVNVPDSIKNSIRMFSVSEEQEGGVRKREGPLVRLGGKLYELKDNLVSFFVHTSDVMFWSLVGIFNSKSQRKGELVKQSILVGLNATGIVGLLSLIIGVIIALQSAAQLRQFGASTYVADLIGISMVREMGPMMTAIIIAGRSGSSFAAEIATMKVTEELDALEVMALNPIRYIIVPKVHAITLCMPVLVALSIIVGIGGGLGITVIYAGIAPISFLNDVIEVVKPSDIIIGLTKSVFFAWAIVLIGTYFGVSASGGSEGVGRVTTRAVVVSIFAVIALNAFFSLIYLF